ncbi:MAG: hypothetical protein ACFFD4_30485 [Candidatus Odinarchaeota archaeon]
MLVFKKGILGVSLAILVIVTTMTVMGGNADGIVHYDTPSGVTYTTSTYNKVYYWYPTSKTWRMKVWEGSFSNGYIHINFHNNWDNIFTISSAGNHHVQWAANLNGLLDDNNGAYRVAEMTWYFELWKDVPGEDELVTSQTKTWSYVEAKEVEWTGELVVIDKVVDLSTGDYYFKNCKIELDVTHDWWHNHKIDFDNGDFIDDDDMFIFNYFSIYSA